MRIGNIKYFLCCLILSAFSALSVRAQQADSTAVTPGVSATAPDPAETVSDSLTVAADRAQAEADSLALLSKSSLDFPAFTSARDSIVEVFSGDKRMIYYYGDVKVQYQDMTVSAEYMEYDLKTGTVFARGVYDTLNGEWTGQPVMTQGDQKYKMVELRYNFNTRKANIKNMLTKADDGIMHGQSIKMMPDNSVNMTGGKYTVCDLEHPHYYMALSSAKVITKPNRKTVFGPACLVIEDVPLYPIGLPFGFIPQRPQRATGLLMPSFGEEEARGFYMKDAGFYFVLGDYFDFSLTGSYFTLGSWALDFNSRYKVNYKFNGSVSLNISNDQTGEKGSRDFWQSRNFGVRWSHQQDPKAHPGSTFSASVNFSTPSNSRYNSHSIQEAQNNQIQSSISYSHNWNGKFNFSINALHSQNSRDSSYSFTLPNLTFSMSTIYPFKRKVRVGKERFYEKFSIGYSTSLQNRINFKASEFDIKDKAFLNKFQNGMTHNFNIGLPAFTLFKYINVTPGVSYGMNWFFRKTEYEYNAETDKVEPVDGGLFSAFGVTQTFSASASASTRLYGMYNFGSEKYVQAIRHVISPSISINWTPDMAGRMNGYRTLEYIDKNGEAGTYEYNLYSGQMYGVPGKGKSAFASFSIGNNLEAKIRNYADTTGTGSKKVKLIDNLSINGNYNFFATQFKLSNISMSMSTTLLNKVNISASMAFDPYSYDADGRRVDKLAIANKQGLMHLTSLSTSVSFSLSGEGAMKGNTGGNSSDFGGSAANYYQRMYYHPYTGEYIPGGWLYYTNPNVPWSFNVGYNLSLNRTFKLDEEKQKLIPNSRLSQYLNFSGNLKLTPKMSINLTSGFDFTAMKITTTQMSATYDLHCFNISVSWIPTGMYKSYSFRIAANASALADLLKFRKSSSYWDNQ